MIIKPHNQVCTCTGSTLEQNPNLQGGALEYVGCERVIVGQVGSTVAHRHSLEKIKELLRKGNTLAIWELDASANHCAISSIRCAISMNKRSGCKALFRASLPEPIS
jgi:hypothetical protein